MEKKIQSSGFYHKQTGVFFPNRKAAIILMGVIRYNKFLSNGEFIWDTEDANTNQKSAMAY